MDWEQRERELRARNAELDAAVAAHPSSPARKAAAAAAAATGSTGASTLSQHADQARHAEMHASGLAAPGFAAGHSSTAARSVPAARRSARPAGKKPASAGMSGPTLPSVSADSVAIPAPQFLHQLPADLPGSTQPAAKAATAQLAIAFQDVQALSKAAHKLKSLASAYEAYSLAAEQQIGAAKSAAGKARRDASALQQEL